MMMRGCSSSLRSALVHTQPTQYHFWVDFQGLLYFDDQQTLRNPRNMIRDRKFIGKLYESLKPNIGQLAKEYPYMGQFWGQHNFLRSAISPVIFNAIREGHLEFSIGLKVPFQPHLLTMDAQGRFSYPFSNQFTSFPGIFSNQLAAEVLGNAEECDEGVRVRLSGEEVVVGRQGA